MGNTERKMVGDMIVSLYDLPEYKFNNEFRVHKAFISDMDKIMSFIDVEFSKEQGWKKEIQYALFSSPIKLILATQNEEILGFACYDASAKGFFGPFGVKKDLRGKGVGTAIFFKTLEEMKANGYAYAIMGWVDETACDFYKKVANAKYIENSTPDKSVYSNKIRNLKF